MRISGGVARGIPLVVPKGDAVRPATDGMRQAVFSSLGARVVGARFLDLFAGSGAYGLEALSRGAAGGLWVEQNFKAAACVRQNIAAVCKSLGRETRDLTVVQADALSVPLGGGGVPDLVFIDPPYATIADIAPALFARLTEALSGKPDPLVVFELPGELELRPVGWTLLKRLGQGARRPTVAFFRRESPDFSSLALRRSHGSEVARGFSPRSGGMRCAIPTRASSFAKPTADTEAPRYFGTR